MTTADSPVGVTPEPARRRWLAVLVIGLAQLVVALDATVLSIALPTAQRELGFGDDLRQWVITAYTLALAAGLLLGGRVADTFDRRRVFLYGLVGFAVASAVAGAATDFGMLVAGRAAQGAAAAVLTPAALSLLAVTFHHPRERAKAFGIYGAVASSGGVAGLLVGGALTEHASWRWCLYLNLVVVAVAVTAGPLVLTTSPRPAARRSLEVASAATAAAGLVALVLGGEQLATRPITANSVWLPIAAGFVLLAAFVARQRRAADPLLPLAMVADRSRAGPLLAVAAAVVGVFSMFLVLTYHLQVVAGYSPMRTGLTFLPLSGAVVISSYGIAGRLLPRVAPRMLMVPGLLVAAAGLAILARLGAGEAPLLVVLPAEILVGLGLGCVFTPAISTAVAGVDPRDAGIAAATVNTANQLGGSLGTAAVNTIAVAATAAYGAGADPAVATGPDVTALVRGYTTATTFTAVFLAAAAVITFWLMTPSPTRDPFRTPRKRHPPTA